MHVLHFFSLHNSDVLDRMNGLPTSLTWITVVTTAPSTARTHKLHQSVRSHFVFKFLINMAQRRASLSRLVNSNVDALLARWRPLAAWRSTPYSWDGSMHAAPNRSLRSGPEAPNGFPHQPRLCVCQEPRLCVCQEPRSTVRAL